MKLPLVTFPSRMFSYNVKKKTLFCEASDMNNRHLQRLYNDAEDRGFEIVSSTTGAVITYSFLSVETNKEDEILSWTFTPIEESMNKHPECRGTKVVVFND